MCEESRKSDKQFGLVVVKVKDLKVIYRPLGECIDTVFAEENEEYLDNPIVIDRENYIIDGHHRFWCAQRRKTKELKAIRLNMTFEESKHWRNADREIKLFASQTRNPKLYKEFKKLAWCLK